MRVFILRKPELVLPKQKTPLSTGYDIIAASPPRIVGDRILQLQSDDIKTGWYSVDYIEYQTNLYVTPEIKEYDLRIYPRSSISNYNLLLANSVPIIDTDYTGMIILRFKYIWQPVDINTQDVNSSFCVCGKVDMSKIYKQGDSIAQLTAARVETIIFEYVDELPKTARGSGGFGSTGK